MRKAMVQDILRRMEGPKAPIILPSGDALRKQAIGTGNQAMLRGEA
jgi:hypothetical protein